MDANKVRKDRVENTSDVMEGHMDTDQVPVDPSEYRILHPKAGRTDPHTTLLHLSSTHTHNSHFINSTFGLCHCLHPDPDQTLSGWTDHTYSVIQDTDCLPICPICYRRCHHTSKPRPPPPRPVLRKALTFSGWSDVDRSVFRHHNDVALYAEDYRGVCTVGCTRKYQGYTPVLGVQGVPDPYLSRVQSHSDVIERLILIVQRREMAKRINSYTIQPQPSTDVNTQESQLSDVLTRIENLDLAPVPTRCKQDHVGDIKSDHDANYEQHQMINSVPDVMNKDSEHVTGSDEQNLKHELSDLTNNQTESMVTVMDKKHYQMDYSPKKLCETSEIQRKVSPNPVHQFSNNGTPTSVDRSSASKRRLKCKQFTSSSQYLELSAAPKTLIPLPVQIVLKDSASRKSPATDPRCKSANNSRLVPRRPHLCRGATTLDTGTTNTTSDRQRGVGRSSHHPTRTLTTHGNQRPHQEHATWRHKHATDHVIWRDKHTTDHVTVIDSLVRQKSTGVSTGKIMMKPVH